MAKTKSAADSESVRRQLASLKHRVSWLEAALKPKKQSASIDRARAGRERENAERKTRNEAMTEYYEQERIEQFRENPSLFKIARELDRKKNAFLRSKGLKPMPSSIPEALRRKSR